MAHNSSNDESNNQQSERSSAFAQPQLNLPKGGGAIRGMGEKFTTNPVTGTGSLSVPIASSPARSGFGPQLALSYDSGSGNSAYGFGWSMPVSAITRKTDKGLPQYLDEEESDVFLLSAAEDLMPVLIPSGMGWVRQLDGKRSRYGQHYDIRSYRPRTEGLFARIERWSNLSDKKDTFWRSISRENLTTWYGTTAASRIADPADPSRIFSWLICESYDDKGNVLTYQYKQEDSTGVDHTQACESNRSAAKRSANLYLKNIFYGNRTPYFPDLNAAAPLGLPTDWCFQLVLDYGEHDSSFPLPGDSLQPWNLRADPFSSYRAGFEIRTYRLCRRALMFHHFADQLNVGDDCLVRSTDLHHASSASNHPSIAPYSYLVSAAQTGYVRNGTSSYVASSLPSVEFEYTEAVIDETVYDVDPESLKNLPVGIDRSNYRWVDLNGEGLAGILTEQGEGWFYKSNLSAANQQVMDGAAMTIPEFGPLEAVQFQPSLADLSGGRQQLMDLSGDGHLDLVEFSGPTPGFFERTFRFGEEQSWAPFRAFRCNPKVDWESPYLKFIDLTGDGYPDLLIGEEQAFTWHPSLATEGFGPERRISRSTDEDSGPQLVFADGIESVFLADMSGDGLTDLVRIRNGEVCYWPNLGYGRFGSKVCMDGSPRLDCADLFDGRRIQLADIDGSGSIDILYLGSLQVSVYFNQSGNAWGSARLLPAFPQVDSSTSLDVLDLMGNGTACLVWSSWLEGNARRPMRYIRLMGEQKPHLLVRTTNNLGAETVVEYAPSTKFYVADKVAGTPWITRLPFPVHVVERVETYDYISRNRFVTRYAYHHGYYDGVEREFRGFGRVDQWDTEEIGSLSNLSSFPQPTNQDPNSNVPPMCTRTWFHTGIFFDGASASKQFELEYYTEGQLATVAPAQIEAMLLTDTILPTTVLLTNGTRSFYDLSGEERREACRALRGSILRQEVYALDGTQASTRPYSTSERNYTIELLQPQGPNLYGVYFAHAREAIDFHYERKLHQVDGIMLATQSASTIAAADPRVTHAATLEVDSYGNVLQSVAVAYGRRYHDPDPLLSDVDRSKQTTALLTYSEASYTNAVLESNRYRAPLAAQASSYQLLQAKSASAAAGMTGLFRFEELQQIVAVASDGMHDIPYEDSYPTGLIAGQPYRRLLSSARTLYRPDDMGAAAGDFRALLPLGQQQWLALPGCSYKLALTDGLIAQAYSRNGVPLLPTAASVLAIKNADGGGNPDGGGYVDLDSDGNWWAPSGRVYFMISPSFPDEVAEARDNCYLPRQFDDPFGNATTVAYDIYGLLPVQTADAVGNTSSADNDYRVLVPSLLTDPNGNRAAVSFDAMGMVAGTAVMGKSSERLGDLIDGFVPDLTQAQIDAFIAAPDPHTLADTLLSSATTRVVYDVHRFFNTRSAAPNDPSRWQPAFATTIARETHVSDLGNGQQTKTQVSFSYSDGFGREIQKKIQAEPGPIVDKGAIVDPRWVGTGWTTFNNKGKPVRQYEPFFTDTHGFEYAAQVGVSSILFYDPADRVVATLHPNQTYEKVVFETWQSQTWDVNDTVLQTNPAADVDVGDFFQALPESDYSPTWYALRTDPAYASQAAILWPDPVILAKQAEAAGKAAAHAGTPSNAYFDVLGRPFLTVGDNGGDQKYATRAELDIQGLQRSVTDALGRKVMAYDYDMLGERIHQSSMEAGERWTLNDVVGKPIRAWDTRGHNFTTTYDKLRRLVSLFVLGTDPTNSDPRTIPVAGSPPSPGVMIQKTIYGEGLPPALNLNGRAYEVYDTAGVVTSGPLNPATDAQQGYDFKGNLLRGTRQFLDDYKGLPDWATTQTMGKDIFTSSTSYDALNRLYSGVTPDGSVVHATFNEANLLETVSVNLQGAANATPFVTNIDYDAKGQRAAIVYGASPSPNPADRVYTNYTYDPDTFRLTRLTTNRPGSPAGQQTVQDLQYVYDPAGNITHIQDDADIQNIVFYGNQRVTPSNDYTYDAIYRLIAASGREQLGLDRGNKQLASQPSSYNDIPRAGLISPTNTSALGTYIEQYVYDSVGNFLQFGHKSSSAASPGWTRYYAYEEASLLEPSQPSNRLSNTGFAVDSPSELYDYDMHGSMMSMPQLQKMLWDFKDALHMTTRQRVNNADAGGIAHEGEKTFYVYDGGGQRVRKVTESGVGIKKKERFYLGGYEVYREYQNGSPTLERETLHVMDDKQRIALVETRTLGDDGTAAQLIRYQLSNHLGSASLELDDASQVISYEEYCPYGNTSYQAGRSAVDVGRKRYRYSGMERDEENGLSYHSARYLATWLGRWTSSDPKGITDGLCTYTYGGGNPVRHLDVEGTNFWDVVDQITDIALPLKGAISHARQGDVEGAIVNVLLPIALPTGVKEGLIDAEVGAAKATVTTAAYFAAFGPYGTAINRVNALRKGDIREAVPEVSSTILAPSDIAQGVQGFVYGDDPEHGDTSAKYNLRLLTSRIVPPALTLVEAGKSLGSFRAPFGGPSSVADLPTTAAADDGVFHRIPGGRLEPLTPQEANMFHESVRLRKELSTTRFRDGTLDARVGSRLEVNMVGGPGVLETTHTHPTSKVALPSGGDLLERSYIKAGGYRSDAMHQIIGDRWPQTRSTLTSMNIDQIPLSPVKYVFNAEEGRIVSAQIRSKNINNQVIVKNPASGKR